MAEEQYESDPEEAKPSLAMRRRQASDDEEEEGGDTDGEKSSTVPLPPTRGDSSVVIELDVESDGQGGLAEYDDDDDEVEEDEVEEDDDEEDYGEGDDVGFEERVGGDGDVEVESVVTMKELEGEESKMVGEPMKESDRAEQGEEEEDEEEKKENEPFAVPTAGAFYMHDDRFRDSSGGRHRRTLGGRKLWESKNDSKWGHDKFEELTSLERHYEEGGRNSKGQYRARGRNRGADRSYARGSGTRARTNNQIPKDVRDRGPRSYEPRFKDRRGAPQTQNRLTGKPLVKSSQTSSQKVSVAASNGDLDCVPAQSQVFASSLSSASPPFYPSGSSNKEIALVQKDVQAEVTNRNPRFQVMNDRFSIPQSNALLKGKNIVDSIGMGKLYIDDLASPIAGKPLTNMQLPASGSSLNSTSQHPRPRPQGRGVAHPGQTNFQPNPSHDQVTRALPIQPHVAQQGPVQNRGQPSLQTSVQVLGQHSRGGSRSSSPPNTALSVNSFEHGERESPPGSSKSRTELVGKGKGGAQGSGGGSFLYSGALAMGASGKMGLGHGDQNFSATPTFLPVMQFGDQHPGRIGVPAVGMAFPGYVAQPRGLGNSEMTWLPVLAGAGASALGATYCSPYMAVDGGFQAQSSSQASSAGASSKENNSTSKPNNEWKPSLRPELVSDEFGQRQNKPPRYSEMNFGQ